MNNLTQLFDKTATKIVAPNDPKKGAMYVTKEIAAVLKSAGIQMSLEEPHPSFEIKLIDDERTEVRANYYGSLRSKEANRKPEGRMGLEFISGWLEPGDRLFIGNIGVDLFASKSAGIDDTPDQHQDEQTFSQIIGRLSDDYIRERAEMSRRYPLTRHATSVEFIRDRFVVQAALIRARGCCEYPGCTQKLFLKKSDRSVYLEVHHIIPMSENGQDSLENVAALCPSCHREQHHGIDKVEKRSELLDAIRVLEEKMVLAGEN